MLYGQRIAETGTGKTINISSGGVWFTTESMLTIGMPVELSMNWPVLLNDSCPMKLMIYGCVIRSNEAAPQWPSNATNSGRRARGVPTAGRATSGIQDVGLKPPDHKGSETVLPLQDQLISAWHSSTQRGRMPCSGRFS